MTPDEDIIKDEHWEDNNTFTLSPTSFTSAMLNTHISASHPTEVPFITIHTSYKNVMIGAADIIQGIPRSLLTPSPPWPQIFLQTSPPGQKRPECGVPKSQREGGGGGCWPLDVVGEKREATTALNRNYIKTQKSREVKGHAPHVKGEDGRFLSPLFLINNTIKSKARLLRCVLSDTC